MTDTMKAELLSPGNQPALGATHAENATPQSAEGRNAGGQAGFGKARDL